MTCSQAPNSKGGSTTSTSAIPEESPDPVDGVATPSSVSPDSEVRVNGDSVSVSCPSIDQLWH